MLGQRLLLLIAVLATLVVLGAWDNTREVGRVLEQGYDAVGQIAGAQLQRKMPLAVDGWRPRLVEQELSVDIKWQGKDGKEHEHLKVPVSESFARTIVAGDQVRLVPVAIKALDDEQSVPVIVSDAAQRLASLKTWTSTSGAIAFAAWVGFAGITLWRRRRGVAGNGLRVSLSDLPPKRTIAGLVLLLGGGVLAQQAWSANEAAEAARSGGTEVTAEILSVSSLPSGHAVQLAWKDALGAVHHFGPVPISEAFYGQVTRDGQLTEHETKVRAPDDPQKRPVIVADVPAPGWLGQAGMAGGLVLMALGLGCLFSALRGLGRR